MTCTSTVWRAVVGLVAVAAAAAPIAANSNVADTQKYSWGENIGWLNWADANSRQQGVEVYSTGNVQYLKGWIWGENVGWIHVGAGNAPYANTGNTDYGVNIDAGTGAMRGLAWGENIGWVVFTDLTVAAESPRWDHAQHRSHGYAWGENVGWVNLEDMVRFVCAIPGDVDVNGIVDVFDFGIFAQHFEDQGLAPFTNGDCDGDGDVDVFDFAIFAFNFEEFCS